MSVVQPEGNYYDKYNSGNPIERKLMNGFFSSAAELLRLAPVGKDASILEAGCGEGNFTAFLRKCYPSNRIDAFDIGETVVESARISHKSENIRFSVGDIYAINASDSAYELVCASEVLEHTEEPVRALSELERVSGRFVLVTVPNEPLWRILNMCRGAYLKDFGNTPGHIQHWNKRKFSQMVKKTGLKVVKVRKSLPWLQFLLEKRSCS
ncbi:MAG: class I SAM-dependent methyltransferase [Lachnospiraceae bacterium]|nr:class I SAM-dependent methyltransferase [Lachnospiraceae bacterium]